jgi:asparagine synthetase B (glutamine-hydrolysing)
MPGLVGAVSLRGEPVEPKLVRAMRDAIRHRASYHIDDYVSPGGTEAISRVHLGIIDQAVQPYAAAAGTVQVFLHGQVFNDEASHTNPLVLIHQRYEKQGIHFASGLNGSFVIVIIDRNKNRVLIANDRVATQPLFVFNDGQTLFFGPEIKCFLLLPTVKRELNLAAVADFLSSGHFLKNHTFIQGLETMDSATVLKIGAGGLSTHKYWRFDIDESVKDRGLTFYQDGLAALLGQAVRRSLRTKGVYSVLLSGGYDSRAILGFCLQENDRVNTSSWGVEEDVPGSDCAVAGRLAEKLGTNHRFYKRSVEEVIQDFRDFVLLGEGLTDDAASYRVYDRIKAEQGVDILLRGDENFGWPDSWVHDEYTLLRAVGIRTFEYIPTYRQLIKPSYWRLFRDTNRETISNLSASCHLKERLNRMDFFHLTVRIKHYLGPLNYIKTFVLESHTPLLDHDILDFIGIWPAKYRRDKFLEKKTVTALFPELYGEIAEKGNMIDWLVAFRNQPELQQLAYRELIERPGIVSEFVDVEELKNLVERACAPVGISKQSIKVRGVQAVSRFPAIHRLVHKGAYRLRKRNGTITANLPLARVVMRLLILNVWGDMFLNHPVAPEKQAN